MPTRYPYNRQTTALPQEDEWDIGSYAQTPDPNAAVASNPTAQSGSVPPPSYPQYPRYTPINQTGGPQITSADDERQAQQDRIAAQHAGDALDVDLTGYLNSQSQRGAGYEQQLAEQYNPYLQGGGGYTPEEMAMISGQDRLAGMQLSQEDRDAAYLSPEEQWAMMGNPNAGSEYFQPDRERETASRGATAQRGAVQQMAGELDGATDYGRMSVREGYGSDLQGGVDKTAESVRGVLGGPNMEVSDEFLADYQMTPEERQGIITSAGMDVRNRYQSAIDDMGRRARAEGTNAVGAVAMQERLQRQAAALGGDQMTRARVAADAEAAKRLQTGEDMRVGYGQRAAGMRSGAEMNLGEMGQNALTEAERTRLGAEQNYASQRSRNVAIAGDARLNTERNVANTELGNEQRFTDTGIALGQRADNVATQRAGQIATNRQGSLAHNQDQDFARRQYADTATTARTVANAGARRSDQQEARNYLTGQQTQANANVNTTNSQRIQNNTATQAARAASTGNMTNAQGTPGRGERIFGAVVGAAGGAAGAAFGGGNEKGGIITKPTYVLVAERGPEAIVPLGYDDEAEILPSVALSAQKPGSFDVSAPPMRGQSAYATRYRRAN